MVSFRQQMQELVDKIARSRAERHQAVAQLPKNNDQLRRQVGRFRDETRRELDRSANQMARELTSFNTTNKRTVQRLLRDTRNTRLSNAQAMRSRLAREMSKNRNEIRRTLQQNHSERQRMQRSQNRQSLMAIQSVHHRVENLRKSTQRMVRNMTLDRGEARKIWNNLRRMQPGRRGAAESLSQSAPSVALASVGMAAELTGMSMSTARV